MARADSPALFGISGGWGALRQEPWGRVCPRVGLAWSMSMAGLWFLAQMPDFEPSCKTAAIATLESLWKPCPSPHSSQPSWREQVQGKVCDLESLVGQRYLLPRFPVE